MNSKGINLLLQQTPLFHHMNEKEISALLLCFEPRIIKMQKNELFALTGERILGVYVVLTGKFLAFIEDADGNRLIRDQFEPGDIFGEVAAFSRDHQWPVTVQTKEASSVLFLEKDRIVMRCERGCRGHNQLVYNMLEIISEKGIQMHQQLGLLSMGSLRKKVATLMLQQHEASDGSPFELKMNINETADYLGVARPSLSRELSRMKQDDLIDSVGKEFWIKNINEMRSLAKE